MSLSSLNDSVNLFSVIDTVKNGYFYTIFNPENKSESDKSEVYTLYSDCVSDLQLHLLRNEIKRSPLPELIIDAQDFSVIEINYKARKTLSVPSDWESFKVFPKNKEDEILVKLLRKKYTSESCEIQGYGGLKINAYCCLQTINTSNHLFLRLTFGCPVLSVLQNTEKLLS